MEPLAGTRLAAGPANSPGLATFTHSTCIFWSGVLIAEYEAEARYLIRRLFVERFRTYSRLVPWAMGDREAPQRLFLPGWSRWRAPLPNFSVRVLEPSDLFVIVPEPNFWVWPVTVFPSRPRSVVREPEPNGRVSVVEPSDHLVTVPEPNFCVCPVTVLPSRLRSVVIEPEPKGRVWLLVPSDLWVSVPEPNFCVWPVLG